MDDYSPTSSYSQDFQASGVVKNTFRNFGEEIFAKIPGKKQNKKYKTATTKRRKQEDDERNFSYFDLLTVESARSRRVLVLEITHEI